MCFSRRLQWPLFNSKNSLIRWQLFFLVSLTLVRGLIYLSIFPPWLAPDEPAHFEVVRILGQEDDRPSLEYYQSHPVNLELHQSFQTFRFWELAQRPTPTRWLETTDLTAVSLLDYPYFGHLVYAEKYPILPHLALSFLLDWARPLDIATELYLLRLVSVLLAGGVVIIAWLVTRRLFPERPQFWLAIPAFILFLPMHTYIFALLNTDVFAIFLGATVLLLLVSIFKDGASRSSLFLLIGLLGLSLLIKRSVIFVTLWAALALSLYVGHRRRWPLKRIVILGSVCLTLLGGGLALALFSVSQGANPLLPALNARLFKTIPLLSLIAEGAAPLDALKIYVQAALFFSITFWGNFGWANINIPWPWLWGFVLVSSVVTLGAAIYLVRAFLGLEQISRYQGNILVIFLAGIVLALISTFFPILFSGPSWTPPARYFFPVLIPVATFFYLGVWQLSPSKLRQTYLLPLWLIALVSYDAVVLTQIILPYIYG